MNKTYILSVLVITYVSVSEVLADVSLVPLAKGWAKTSINTVIFRRNSVVTHKETQYVAYYDADGFVVLAKRKLGSMDWEIRKTQYKGNVKDAHNSISIMVDGDGYLHMSWDHHNHPMCTDTNGAIHISWVWRETADVMTNHDIAYAKSTDGGVTWQKSNGERYCLPITASNADYAALIPQRCELINTTSMCTDSKGRPYIATYWRPQGTQVPQYHLVFHNGMEWQTLQISDRTTPFSLSGRGTKRIPISRCQIFTDSTGPIEKAYMIFRDAERKDRVSIAICDNLKKKNWQFVDLTDFSVGLWEPTYDTEVWKRLKILHVYLQNAGHGDECKIENIPPQDISILEWTPE
jgi:hypothetical protein